MKYIIHDQRKKTLKRIGVTAISVWTAHALAWCGGLWLAFGPVYQGVSVTPTTPGGAETEATRYTATLVEVNGLWVIWLLTVPVLLSGLAVLAVRLTDAGQLRRKVLLWVCTLPLLAFCAAAIFSIGLIYLPSALALLCAAVSGSVERPAKVGSASPSSG